MTTEEKEQSSAGLASPVLKLRMYGCELRPNQRHLNISFLTFRLSRESTNRYFFDAGMRSLPHCQRELSKCGWTPRHSLVAPPGPQRPPRVKRLSSQS
ncbi:hypothetical protein CSUI_006623 [Cystoisospora suis]|uniref:Uncharacterized protein n=1 Tax=Cystoisospora suis TaxID=483139 RepID=A0A2C6KTV1_9APIC|nr:hypothetical protein CSUI_006623 [Cystoisospora suis]